MELFEQIYGLLGGEKLSLEEFTEILDAGLLEIKVGTIPQNIDRVVVGDIERTRLTQMRALFFLGINDGNIPVETGTGGLISDLDREFLQASEWQLAPTPRQRMYNQRLYLYMIMTKPSECLYLSYARFDSEGKSLRPSYLIKTVKQLFPALPTAIANENPTLEEVYGLKDSLDVFVTKLRGYAAATAYANEEADISVLVDLGKIYQKDDDYRLTMEHLLEEAFKRYSPQKLAAPIADLLYGQLQNNSISRLEKYAACAYAHFLHYGLKLREREEYSFEAADLGNVYHGVLEEFAKELGERGLDWANAQDQECEEILQEIIDGYVRGYGETVLFGSARSKQMISRISRIMKRAEGTMRKQLQQGDFTPYAFEVAFSASDGLDATNIILETKGENEAANVETMSLRGRIDRIDTCNADDKVLVKVIDYKSGQKNFDLCALYYGLQLQLAVYLSVAVEMMKKAYPDKEAIPAAALYYRVFDPLVETKKELADIELHEKLLGKQTMTGIVNDDAEIVARLDKYFTQKSWVIPVTKNKDGSYRKYSKVLPSDSFSLVSDYLQDKIAEMGRGIKEGDIAVSPYEYKSDNGCKYCEFKRVCGFDTRLSGYKVRTVPSMKNEEVLQLMKPYQKS
jgi:ATP-dependent helicase/nuclease subunit B